MLAHFSRAARLADGPLAVLTAFALAVSTLPAQAVTLSQDGTGQVMIHPYYTARGSNDTLFSIVNGNNDDKAVKVRFREGRNGRVVLDFNLYLPAFNTFAAAVSRDGAGNPVLQTQSNHCTVPAFAASQSAPGLTEAAFGNAAYAGYDMAGSGLGRAAEGYFEIIEMGVVNPNFTMPGAKKLGETMWTSVPGAAKPATQDCAAIAAGWATGGVFENSNGAELAAPTGGPLGTGCIINVPQGTDYSYEPVVLAGVYARARHTGPGSASPSLADAEPVSTVLQPNGTAKTSSWGYGIDAVSAVLMHDAIRNEYIVGQGLGAATDLVLTFPTKPFYVVRASDIGQSTRAPFTAAFDDVLDGSRRADGTSPGACEWINMVRYAPNGQMNSALLEVATPPDGPLSLTDPHFACWTTTMLSLGNVLDSAIAEDVSVNAMNAITSYGRVEIGLGAFIFPTRYVPLISHEGHKYYGLPVIGYAAEKYVNGNVGGVLANYGGTLAHKYFVRID